MADTARGTEAERKAGTQPSGRVGLRNFDEGVVLSLKAELLDSNYWIPETAVYPVKAAPGQPGIPLVFSHPEDIFERYKLPVVVVRRDDIAPAMNRWHPGMRVWRAPADGAQPVVYSYGDPVNPTTISGFTAYAEKQQAVPFDITYTISVIARHRGFGGSKDAPSGEAAPRTQVNALLDYALRIYAPYCTVVVEDDLGDSRSYHAFMESISHLDELGEVTARVIGFALTLRVEAELDLDDPTEMTSVFGSTLRGTLLDSEG